MRIHFRTAAALVLAILAGPLLAADALTAPEQAIATDPATVAAPGSAAEPFAAGEAPLIISAHEPSYFIIGHRNDLTSARFQFSFKYMLFDHDSIPTQWFRPLSGMHFAYTQTSIWDLSSNSKPFRDTSYRPSLLWDWKGQPAADKKSVWSAQAGFEHESNGKQEGDSRSINTFFVEPHWRTALDDAHYLKLGVRLLSYLDREENADIVDYRGFGTLLLSTGKIDGAVYRVAYRPGRTGDRYSLQLEASYPLRRQYFANTGGYFFAQVFSGYGETLLDYNVKRPPQLRLGVAVVR